MMRVKGKLQSKVSLTRAIQKALERARGSSVTVGVHPDAGVYNVLGNGPAPTVAQVALWNEYGTQYMPARPFFGPAFRENRTIIDEECAKCVKGMVFESWTVERALTRLGLFVQILIQNKIRANPGPELSGTWDGGPDNKGTGYLGTKRRLGQGQVRLIATGLLLRSVGFKVHLGGEGLEEKESSENPTTSSASGGHAGGEAGRAKARSAAHADKAANEARRAAHKSEFKKFKDHIRQAKKDHGNAPRPGRDKINQRIRPPKAPKG